MHEQYTKLWYTIMNAVVRENGKGKGKENSGVSLI